MVDLTGGVAEVYYLDKLIRDQANASNGQINSKVIWKLLVKSLKMGSICGVGIREKDEKTRKIFEKEGLADKVK